MHGKAELGEPRDLPEVHRASGLYAALLRCAQHALDLGLLLIRIDPGHLHGQGHARIHERAHGIRVPGKFIQRDIYSLGPAGLDGRGQLLQLPYL